MQKINFNDRYGLTQAVIEGRKTMTRRLIPDEFFGLTWDTRGDTLVYENEYGDFIDVRHSKYTRYKVGEVVAVAQRYEDVEELSYLLRDPFSETYFEEINIGDEPGYRNKLFVRAELMPHRIRITGIKCERLQDISDEDCMKEGVSGGYIGFFVPGIKCKDWEKESHVETEDGNVWKLFPTPRRAFASLIDKVSGRGTWGLNPLVVVYEFELVK